MKSTMKSETPDFSEESSKRAAAADAGAGTIHPELVEQSPENGEMNIDPEKVHGLMVKMVRGLVVRIDRFAGWQEHPDDDWCESTTECIEILLQKNGNGTLATSPKGLLVFNLIAWIAPNVITAQLAKPESRKAPAEMHTPAGAPPSDEAASRESLPYLNTEPDLIPFEDVASL